MITGVFEKRTVPGACAILLVCALSCVTWADPNSITSYNITWYLNGTVALSPSEAGDYQYGYYPNGVDPWVRSLTADPNIYIGRIDPLSIIDGGRTMHGSMIDPSCTTDDIGYDSYAATGMYQAALNAGRPGGNALSKTNPIILEPVSSLISTRSRTGVSPATVPLLLDGSVLTAVSSAPAAGSFRPPYIATSKTVPANWNTSAITQTVLDWFKDWEVPGTWTWEAAENDANYLNIEHPVPPQLCRYTRPDNNWPDYGRDVGDRVGQIMCGLNLNIGDAYKTALLTDLLQVAIDRYAIISEDSDHWQDGGAHGIGGYLISVTLAGKVFGDNGMLLVAQKCGQYAYDGGGDIGTANLPEDFVVADMYFCQTFQVTAYDRNRHHDTWPAGLARDPYTYPTYAPDGPDYSDPNVGMYDEGMYHIWYPERDTAYWLGPTGGTPSGQSNYRATIGQGMSGQILGAQALESACGFRTACNHDPAFEYMERFVRKQKVIGSTFAITSWIETLWDDHWSEVRDDTYVKYFLGGG